MKYKYTFWDLVNGEYGIIEIPKIQRDYAQGRDGKKARDIRRDFVADLHNALLENKELCLDFVYGITKNEKSCKKFIPLDGQQRLTTLFLLHWYVFAKEGKKEEIKKLQNFKYETRISSREFCKILTEIDIDKFSENFVTDQISDKIKNLNTYFLAWDRDPTIKSMLNMLDQIHYEFGASYAEEGYSEKLINNTCIFFQLQQLENFGLEDDLYIKMNARGQQLSEYENFKAKLEQELKVNYKEKFKGFFKKIDNEWADIFWKYRNENNKFDHYFLLFIKNLLINSYAVKCTADNSEQLKYLIDNTKEITFHNFKELDCINEQFFENLEAILNNYKYLNNDCINCKILEIEELFQNAISYENKILDLNNRIQIYAICTYFVNNKVFDEEKFNDWIRFIRNLTENSNIYREEYIKVLDSINRIGNKSGDIIETLCSKNLEMASFLQTQLNTEKIKALLISKDDKWKKKILEIDEDTYLKGQMEFLFDFSGILSYYNENNNVNWSEKENDNYYNSFSDYYEKFIAVFNEVLMPQDKPENDNLLRRALLSKGDYLLNEGANLSFLTRSGRDTSWKSLLRDYNKRQYVKQVLNEISINSKDENLKNIINVGIENIKDWRKYFIKYPELINICGASLFIRKESDERIYLLTTTKTAGKNWDYYTYALKLEIEHKKACKVVYEPHVGRDDAQKNITQIGNHKNIELRWTYNETEEKYQYLLKNDKDEKIWLNNMEDVLQII